ncbi:MAG: phosphatase PAP2 family protein [Candidatus Helarchaeota archaeon]
MDDNQKHIVFINNKMNKYILVLISVIIGALLIITIVITDQVISLTINQFTQTTSAAILNGFFIFYTDLFIYIFIVSLYILGLISFFESKKLEFLRKYRSTLICCVFSWFVGEYLVDGIKVVVQRSRPFDYFPPSEFTPISHASGYSFPSGHATSGFASGMPLQYKANNIWIKTILLIYSFLMAFSRVYVGVHWSTDVLVGSLIGIGVSLGISILYPKIINKFDNKKRIELIIYIISLIFGIIWLLL